MKGRDLFQDLYLIREMLFSRMRRLQNNLVYQELRVINPPKDWTFISGEDAWLDTVKNSDFDHEQY